jgi:hypothetical protein
MILNSMLKQCFNEVENKCTRGCEAHLASYPVGVGALSPALNGQGVRPTTDLGLVPGS